MRAAFVDANASLADIMRRLHRAEHPPLGGAGRNELDDPLGGAHKPTRLSRRQGTSMGDGAHVHIILSPAHWPSN